VAYAITIACVDVKDKSCVQECPVDCIYEGPRALYIHPEECIDCGACEPVCPETAIYYNSELPDEDPQALARAEEMFEPIGMLNGAKRHPPLDADHPFIAALPAAE
jgi:NAD-dependent dihydropyrimidine dehydrogenase PreA subunit